MWIQYLKVISVYCMSNIWFRYILTENMLWFGKKATFLTWNILLRVIAGLFRFPPIIIRKNDKKYNFTAGAKLRRNRFSHSKTPKYAQNWRFEAFWPPLKNPIKVYFKTRDPDCKNRHIFLNFNGIFDISSGFVYGH